MTTTPQETPSPSPSSDAPAKRKTGPKPRRDDLKKLEAAIKLVDDAAGINIHGKMYKTVATRVEAFRRTFGLGFSIITDLFSDANGVVVVQAVIVNEDGRTVATGYAEEDRSKGQINRTSALENCETSAIGRALANFGLHGGEYASANEVQQAVAQQAVPPAPRPDSGQRPVPPAPEQAPDDDLGTLKRTLLVKARVWGECMGDRNRGIRVVNEVRQACGIKREQMNAAEVRACLSYIEGKIADGVKYRDVFPPEEVPTIDRENGEDIPF